MVSVVKIACICFVMLLTACAQAPKVKVFDLHAGQESRDWPVWPTPPEVPRFLYAGQLTGEANFRELTAKPDNRLSGLFRKLVGLGEEEFTPVILQRPQGVVTDERGRIFVTDVSRQAVYFFDKQDYQLQVWEYAAPGQRFIAPIGMVVDAQGRLFVSDAELGFVAILDQNGDPVGAIGKGILQRPTGIARSVDTGQLFVADTRANDIKVFSEAGELLDVLGHEGNEPGSLNAPTYLAYANDRLYVTDTLNSRVQVFDTEGNHLKHFGERGLYIGNLARPKGISVDADGNIYVVESYYDYLLVFDSEGRLLLPIGGTGHAPGQFYLPAGVWADPGGQVYVADMFNGRVSVFQFLGGTP
jgi:DNA-binding beta-propeller fold protein YncE